MRASAPGNVIYPNPDPEPHNPRHSWGSWGEEVAARYLVSKGYTVLERQWRARVGEIDVVTRKGHAYIFVEVKTRTGRRFGMPEESVYGHKIDRLRRTVQLYLLQHHLEDAAYQIDAIAIEYNLKTNETTIRHIEHCI